MLTREQVLATKPGYELDALIAEHLFGWRRIEGPRHDYDGPCESNDVLIPPTITSQEEAFKYMPARGAVPFAYFVNRDWSSDISAAWGVIIKMSKTHFPEVAMTQLDDGSWGWMTRFTLMEKDWMHSRRVEAPEAPEAICKAALLALLD